MSPQSPLSALPLARSTPPDLSDSSKFVLIDRVPILDEHLRTRRGEDGSPVTEYVSPEQLEVIADNSKRRADRGDLGLVFIGHTDRDKSEIEQPPLVGYMRNHRMGVDTEGRPVILADLYIDREYESLISKFPRRSVEIFRKTTTQGYIDSLALLKRAPERDLGLVTYSKRSGIERCERQATQRRGGAVGTVTDKVRSYLAGRRRQARVSGRGVANDATRQLSLELARARSAQAAVAADQTKLSRTNSALHDRLDRLEATQEADRRRRAKESRLPVLSALAEEYRFDPVVAAERYARLSDDEFQDRLSEIAEHYARRPGAPVAFSDPLADEPIDSRELQHYIRDNGITVTTPEDATRAVERYIRNKRANQTT